MARIALITPTGARPQQALMCARFMQSQTYKGEVIWVIVDDADPTTTDHIKPDFREGWEIFKVYPKPPWVSGFNTQGRNIMSGINALQTGCDIDTIDAIFIIEDDDYYKPIYLEKMVEQWNADVDILGENDCVYYHVERRAWFRNNNKYHASLFQTAFSPRIIPVLEWYQKQKYIDMSLWNAVPRKKLFFGGDLAVGIKGMAGRGGIGNGHKPTLTGYQPDPDWQTLHELIGDDAAIYYDQWKP